LIVLGLITLTVNTKYT